MNASLFGVPDQEGNLTAVVMATDEAGLSCNTTIKIYVEKGAGKWGERLAIVAGVVVILVIIAALIHCMVIDRSAGRWEAFSHNLKIEQIQHKINM